MKSYIPIYLYGAIIILVGNFLTFSEYSSFKLVHLTVGIALLAATVFAFIAAFTRKRKQVEFAYHEMHALAMLVYAISMLFCCHTFEMLISFTAFLLIFYAFSEIIFCNWLFNLGKKVLYKIIIIRFLLGLTIGMGTIVSMYLVSFTLTGFGILFILVGINILLYVPVIKGKVLNETNLA